MQAEDHQENNYVEPQPGRAPDEEPAGVGRAEGKGGAVQGPGQEKDGQQEDHGDDIEQALHDYGAQGEARVDVFLLGQEERLDDLAQAAGQDEGHREPHGLAGHQVVELDVLLLRQDEILPAPGPGDEVDGSEQDEEDEKDEVDVGQVREKLAPFDAAEEKEEQDSGQDQNDSVANDPFSHFLRPILSSSSRPVNEIGLPHHADLM